MNNEANESQRWFDEAGPKDDLRSLQLVRAGSVQFGVFADAIATIVPWREPALLPEAPSSVLGVVSLQGRMLTILDLRALTGGEANGSMIDTERRIVALRGDEQLALAVDAVGDIVKIAVSELKAEPNRDSPILGRLQFEGLEINVLNLRDLFPAAIQGRERRRRRF